jgi:hypothetical protein
MSYRVLFSKTARKTYDKLPPKLRNGVDRAIEFLKVSPELQSEIRTASGHFLALPFSRCRFSLPFLVAASRCRFSLPLCGTKHLRDISLTGLSIDIL